MTNPLSVLGKCRRIVFMQLGLQAITGRQKRFRIDGLMRFKWRSFWSLKIAPMKCCAKANFVFKKI